MCSVRLLAVGDICLQTKGGKDPFEHVKNILCSGDIVFANLETALSDQGIAAKRAVPLFTSPENASQLKSAGFNMLNIANNHTYDLGKVGFRNTMDTLDKNGLNYVGNQMECGKSNSRVIEYNNVLFGFVGYNSVDYPRKDEGRYYISSLEESNVMLDISELKESCDLVVVSLHWGIENVHYPSPGQVALARKMIESGASIILGHHPSVLQGIERYKGGIIIYSLGNFQFIDDAPRVILEKTKESMILSFDCTKNGIETYSAIPIRINENYVPTVLNGEQLKQLSTFIISISSAIEHRNISERWWFEQIAMAHLIGNIHAFMIRIRKYGYINVIIFLRWLFYRFTIKCYMGILRSILHKACTQMSERQVLR